MSEKLKSYAPKQGQLENVRKQLLSKHEGEEISYSTCPQNGCFDMCILKTHLKDGKVVAIETDDSVHPNLGREDEYVDHDDFMKGIYQRRACVRGRGLRDDCYSPERIKYPMKRVGERGEGKFVRISWEEALDTIAKWYKETRDEYGPLSVWCDGMLQDSWDPWGVHLPGGAFGAWAEDSYEGCNTADEFVYASSVNLPAYFKNEVEGNAENQTFLDSNLIILWGFDAAINYPETVYYFLLAKEKGIPIITIDPRYSWTAEAIGTQHIYIRPGTDLVMMMAMCYVMFEEDLIDHDFAAKWIEPEGLRRWKDYVMGTKYEEEPKTPEWAAEICGVPAETIRELARLYGKTSQTGPVYIRMVWAAARQHYGKQVARGFNYLQALGGNLGKKGCAGNATGFGTSNHFMLPYLPAYAGLEPGEYGYTVAIEAEMWHRAINLRPKLDAGEISADYYKAEIGCPLSLDAPNIRFMCSFPSNRNHFAGWYGCNERVEAIKRVDKFVFAHWNMRHPCVPYADILLPLAHSFLEGVWTSPAGTGMGMGFKAGINQGIQNVLMYAKGGADPLGECAYNPWIMHQVAARLGIGDKVYNAFTGIENKDVPKVLDQLAEMCWEDWRQMEAPFGGKRFNPPSWEEFIKNPVFTIPLEDYHVFMRKNVENDTPLETESGKIEFYSNWIAEADLRKAIHEHGGKKTFGNGYMPPMARYKHTPEGMLSPKTNQYPIYMVTPHSFYKHHTAYDHSRWFRDEYRNSVWISVSDAKAREIKDGDQVRVYSSAGECIVPAYVTSRMTPGVCCLIFGRWYEPSAVKSERMPYGIDMRGDCNFLIPSEFHDDVLGSILCNALVEIECVEHKTMATRLLEVK